jgi:alpha-N-acetylglucosamine transferase
LENWPAKFNQLVSKLHSTPDATSTSSLVTVMSNVFDLDKSTQNELALIQLFLMKVEQTDRDVVIQNMILAASDYCFFFENGMFCLKQHKT